MTFLTDVRCHYDHGTGSAISRLFNKLAIPVPRDEEYTQTRDYGYLLFLNEVGVAVRLTRANIEHIRHDNILQPFGSRIAGCFRVDLFPGVLLEKDDDDYKDYLRARKTLKRKLGSDGIDFYDAIPLNIGYLPRLANNLKHPVVIDADAYRKSFAIKPIIKELLSGTSAFSLLYSEKSPTPVQDRHYARLYDAFASAWPKDSASPDQEKIAQMWDVCRDMKAQKILQAGWLSPACEGGYKNIINGSTLYASKHRLPSARRDMPTMHAA